MAIVIHPEKNHYIHNLQDISRITKVSLVIVDFITDGQKTVFYSKQWAVEKGLKNASINITNNQIGLKNKYPSSINFENRNYEPTWDNFLKVVITVHSQKDFELYSFEDEFISVPSNFYKRLIQLSKNQRVGNFIPLITYSRFLIFNQCGNINFKDKKVLLSGCGTGSEAIVCIEMGAKYCHGEDIDLKAINFARQRFKKNKKAIFLSTKENNTNLYDLIISRHVLEHIQQSDWSKYLLNLRKKITANGKILIDVPNQLNPIEPHTNTLFFHMLDGNSKLKIFKYLENINTQSYNLDLNMLRPLIKHENVLISKFKEKLPSCLKIKKIKYVDMHNHKYTGELASNIHITLEKNP